MPKAPHLTLFVSLLVIRLAIASRYGTIALQQPTHLGKGQIAFPIGLDRLDVPISQNELERLALRNTLGSVNKPLGIVDDFTVCVLVQHGPELRSEYGGSDNVPADIRVDDCLCEPESRSLIILPRSGSAARFPVHVVQSQRFCCRQI